MRKRDEVTKSIVRIVNSSTEPIETKELADELKKDLGAVSRSKLMYRLNDLRAEGVIAGKFVGSGKGAWVWWRKAVLK